MSIDPSILQSLKQDPDQRQQLLRSKIAANAQRNGRTLYLQALPPALATDLAACEFVTSPEIEELWQYFWLRETDRDRPPLSISDYRYQECSWPHQVLTAVGLIGAEFDAIPAYFYPHGDCPAFRTTFGWVRQNIEILFSLVHRDQGCSYRIERIGLVAIDFSAGIVINNYLGYVLTDPNPDEVYYTVVTWGTKPDLNAA
jgi:hypothetical protein